MFARRSVQGVLVLCLITVLVGCATSGLDSIQVTPATQSLALGQTAQFSAVGTYGNAKHPSTQNMTTGLTWTSSSPSVATISAPGVATAVGVGTTTITAGGTAYNGATSSSATLTVTGSPGESAGSLLSLTIIPSALTVGNIGSTGQFLALGTFSTAPFVRDLTNSPTVTWISAFPNVFPVNTNTGGNLGATAGIVSAYGNGNTVITAEAKSPGDGSIRTATATFACPLVLPSPATPATPTTPATPATPGSCFPGSEGTALLSTLTVYHEGLSTGDWLVTAASATGTPNVLDCGTAPTPAGSVCSATYPAFTNGQPTVVTLTATGANFGGWSYNCMNTGTTNATGPNHCTVSLVTDETVGVIFN
jgi:Bacterial Ig-like domain (group 2)